MDCVLVIFTGGRLAEMRALEIASSKLLVMASVLGKRWLFSILKTIMFICLNFRISLHFLRNNLINF